MSAELCSFAIVVSCLILATSLTGCDTEPASNLAQGVWLNDYPDAKCLDGSVGMYYIRRATSQVNATKWVIHIQGGGWCVTEHDCLKRSRTNMGSTLPGVSGDNKTAFLSAMSGCENNRWCGALMVDNQTVNPFAYDWNAVFVRYCDGASFIGNSAQEADVEGETLHFKGLHIMRAVLSDLLSKQSFDAATVVLFGGDSAGGESAFLHSDRWRDALRAAGSSAYFLAMPESGFWPQSGRFAMTFPAMVVMQNGTEALPRRCVADNTDDPSVCMFPEVISRTMDAPLFPVQSLADPNQITEGPGDTKQEHSDWMLAALRTDILAKPGNGGWLHSCARHCGSSLLTIDGVQLPDAVQTFIATNGSKSLWLQNEPYPCLSCCNDAAKSLVTI